MESEHQSAPSRGDPEGIEVSRFLDLGLSSQKVASDVPAIAEPDERKLRANAALAVAGEFKECSTPQDGELNLLTIIALILAVPVSWFLFRDRLYTSLAVLSIPAAALLIFLLIRAWSAVMIIRLRRRCASTLERLAKEVVSNGQ